MAPDTTDVHRGPRRPAGPQRRAALICAFPRARGLPLPDSGVAVGRRWLADHGLADSEVSGEHLRFDRAGGGLWVVDLGSRNGTWVNGARLRPDERVSLPDGALLRLGRTLLVVRERLLGDLEPAPHIGSMVGPFGLRELAYQLAGMQGQRPNNVLIEGETGAGKELLARALAAALGRSEPYGALNVAAVAEGVFESQLFGHVEGAFSGAKSAATGMIVAHQGGTVFLDEIGELPLSAQAKLLRLLDNREVLPVGGNKPLDVDVLIVAATNRSLAEMVDEGTFRADLYARLAQAQLELPPLRQRAEDIFSIAQTLSQQGGRALPAEQVEVEAAEQLLRQAWPRNVRQLASTLAAAARIDETPGLSLWSLQQVLKEPPTTPAVLTSEWVDQALSACGGNISEAAKQLGVSRGKLLRFRKKTDGG